MQVCKVCGTPNASISKQSKSSSSSLLDAYYTERKQKFQTMTFHSQLVSFFIRPLFVCRSPPQEKENFFERAKNKRDVAKPKRQIISFSR